MLDFLKYTEMSSLILCLVILHNGLQEITVSLDLNVFNFFKDFAITSLPFSNRSQNFPQESFFFIEHTDTYIGRRNDGFEKVESKKSVHQMI